MVIVRGMTLAFLAAEVARLGELIKHPKRGGTGIDYMSKEAAAKVREQFLEYSLDLAQRVTEAVETMGDRYR